MKAVLTVVCERRSPVDGRRFPLTRGEFKLLSILEIRA